MSKPSVKFMCKLKEPHTRKRDGAIITQRLHIGLTEEEALIISDMFSRHKEQGEPTQSLARALILLMSAEDAPNEALLKAMASVQTKSALASQLSKPDVDRALSLLANSKLSKTPPPPKPIPQKPQEAAKPKVRREYVFTPEPRRR